MSNDDPRDGERDPAADGPDATHRKAASPADSDHPTGEEQAAENADNESPA